VFVTQALSGNNHEQTLQTALVATLVLPPGSFIPPPVIAPPFSEGEIQCGFQKWYYLYFTFYFFEFEQV
jgi:hypothetical protein